MANDITAPISNVASITPLTTSPASRDATGGVPAQLVGVPPGKLIEGFVVNRDGQSNPILRTPVGDVLVKSDVFIKTGSEVIFRVDNTQPGNARILTIDGLPPQDYAAANTRAPAGDTVQNASQSAAQTGFGGKAAPAPSAALLVSTTPLPAATIAANPLLSAIAAGSAPVLPGLLKLNQGAQLQVKLLQVSLPALGEAAEPVATPPANPTTPPPRPTEQPIGQQQMANANTAKIALQAAGTAANVSSPAAPAATTAAPNAPLPAPALPLPNIAPAVQALASTPVSPQPPIPSPGVAQSTPAPASLAQVVKQGATSEIPDVAQPVATLAAAKATAQLQAQNPTLPAPASTPNTQAAPTAAQPKAGIPAYVLGHEADGATILQTPVGPLKSYLPQKLPVGTAVRLDVQLAIAPTPTTSGAPLPANTSSNVTTLAQQWPTLDETLKLFPATHEAAKPLMAAMPEIGPKLVSGLLFFIAAVKAGDVKQWLGGRALAALETRAPELAARLKGDMVQLQTLLVDSPLQQWNSVMVPMLYQGQLEHARLFFRDDREGDAATRKKGGGDQRFIVEVDTSHLGEVQFDGFVRHGAQAKQFDLIVRSTAPLPADLQNQVRGTFDNAMGSTGIKGYLAFQPGNQHFVRPMASGNTESGPKPILA